MEFERQSKKLIDFLEQAELCKFTDGQGHRLEDNAAVKALVLENMHIFRTRDDDKTREICYHCGQNFRSRVHLTVSQAEERRKS